MTSLGRALSGEPESLLVDGMHATVDVWAMPQGNKLTLLLTNHALPRHSIEVETVRLRVADATEPRAVSLERIDETHANPRKLWKKMKRPDYLSPAQVDKLEEASRLESVKHPWKFRDRELRIELKLPPHSVAAITVEFA